jgi:hypothetical protein
MKGAEKALDELGLTRTCCRTIMLTYTNTLEQMLDYERANEIKDPNDTSSEYIQVHRKRKIPYDAPPSKRRKILAR